MHPTSKPNSAGSKRSFRIAKPKDSALGPLQLLPGVWANIRPEHRQKTAYSPEGDPFMSDGTLQGEGPSPFDGRGWNLIALPFAQEGQFRNYRMLMNQYNEVLSFQFVDDAVPNRGITAGRPALNADQEVATLDYTQAIKQIAAADVSDSDGLAGGPGLPIHHEPGLFLFMRDQRSNSFTGEEIDIARLGSIPHGNVVNGLGTSRLEEGAPTIGPLSGFPEGVSDDITDAVENSNAPNSYLFPYHFFTKNPFKGVISNSGFPGFSPEDANALLRLGMPSNVKRTTILPFDTEILEAGIVNIPFIERQADAASMKATFWIMELDEEGIDGEPRLVMAYSQFIFLDFFGRIDGRPGLIRWPHISINMLEKISAPDGKQASSLEMAIAQ